MPWWRSLMTYGVLSPVREAVPLARGAVAGERRCRGREALSRARGALSAEREALAAER